MLHNLHNVNGWLMVGIDMHEGLHVFPLMPMTFVELNFLHPFFLGDKAKSTVLFDGVPSVTHYHSPRFLWPHVGVCPDPMDALTPLHVVDGFQRCLMPRTTVMIEGEVSACCLLPGPLSMNGDCWDGGWTMALSSLVVNAGTVVTEPAWQDFFLCAVNVALGNSIVAEVVDVYVDWFDAVTHGPRDLLDEASIKTIENSAPKDADISKNVARAIAMRDRPMGERLTWFWAQTQTGGEWDYKKYGMQYEPFGNVHFGIIGKAIGFSDDFLLRGAGAYQQLNKARKQWSAAHEIDPNKKAKAQQDADAYISEGHFWDLGPSAHGDHSRDQEAIVQGLRYFYSKRY